MKSGREEEPARGEVPLGGKRISDIGRQAPGVGEGPPEGPRDEVQKVLALPCGPTQEVQIAVAGDGEYAPDVISGEAELIDRLARLKATATPIRGGLSREPAGSSGCPPLGRPYQGPHRRHAGGGARKRFNSVQAPAHQRKMIGTPSASWAQIRDPSQAAGPGEGS